MTIRYAPVAPSRATPAKMQNSSARSFGPRVETYGGGAGRDTGTGSTGVGSLGEELICRTPRNQGIDDVRSVPGNERAGEGIRLGIAQRTSAQAGAVLPLSEPE